MGDDVKRVCQDNAPAEQLVDVITPHGTFRYTRRALKYVGLYDTCAALDDDDGNPEKVLIINAPDIRTPLKNAKSLLSDMFDDEHMKKFHEYMHAICMTVADLEKDGRKCTYNTNTRSTNYRDVIADCPEILAIAERVVNDAAALGVGSAMRYKAAAAIVPKYTHCDVAMELMALLAALDIKYKTLNELNPLVGGKLNVDEICEKAKKPPLMMHHPDDRPSTCTLGEMSQHLREKNSDMVIVEYPKPTPLRECLPKLEVDEIIAKLGERAGDVLNELKIPDANDMLRIITRKINEHRDKKAAAERASS